MNNKKRYDGALNLNSLDYNDICELENFSGVQSSNNCRLPE